MSWYSGGGMLSFTNFNNWAGGKIQDLADNLTGKKQAEREIAWERERAQNAHQWEVQDLKNAGLNPILSSGGAGATTGSITGGNPNGALEGLNSAKNLIFSIMQQKNQNAQTKADLNVKDATAQNLQQDTINKGVERGLISANTGKVMAEKNLISGQIEKNKQEIENLIANLQLTKANTELTKAKKDETYSMLIRNIIKTEKETRLLEEQIKSIYNTRHSAKSHVGKLTQDIGTAIINGWDIWSNYGPKFKHTKNYGGGGR